MLELVLFQELSREQKHAAAAVMAGDEVKLRTVPPDQRPEETVGSYLTRLYRSVAKQKVVVAATTDETVVAIYELPNISRRLGYAVPNSSLRQQVHVLHTDVMDVLIVEPTLMQEQDIGAKVIAALQPIFETLAYSANVARLEHNVLISDVDKFFIGLFNGLGYQRFESVVPHVGPGVWSHTFGRDYFPMQHSLRGSEIKIVEALSRVIRPLSSQTSVPG